ncbi:MAG: haloacid dehalogenase type II [Chloroflexi bacterium]|nr:haloacid dehalogenase type II [Chloroflexota bacterium]
MLNFDQYTVLTFDCYGTLIDWESGILNALRPVLIAHQVKIHQDEALELFGELEAAQERGPYKTYRTVLQNVLADMGARLGFQPSENEKRAFGESVQDWQPFADSAGALAELKRKYKVVILSNVDDDLFAHSARKLQVAFDDVITAQQCQSYKPSLNNFRVAEKRVGVPKQQWLHVAQSLFHDIAPAKKLGLDTVWVNRRWDKPGAGATPPTEATPDVEVRSLAELAELVRKGRRGK